MKILIENKYIQILPFLLVLLVGITFNASAQSDYKLAEQDSLALVAFYWATDGPNWTSNQPGFGFNDLTSEWQTTYNGQFNNWLDGPVKDWFGVRVEKRAIVNSSDSAYRVTWVWPVIGRRTDGQNQLDGYIPREVGLFTALNQFRINGNDGFTWELMPDEIYHPTLQHLDLESCWFDEDVSEALRNCTDIRKMNLRYNNFDYIPNWDFLDEPALRNLDGTQWLYNSRFSYQYLERIIDYFYSISPNIKEFQIENRDMFDVGDEREIVAPLGSSIDIVCDDAGNNVSAITYQWFKDGLSKFGKTQKTYSFPSISASDYGDYTVRISNDYVKAYDQNTNFGEVFTKKIHLVETPTAPTIKRAISAYNGQYIEMYLSKPMAITGLMGYQDLSVTANGTNIAVVSAEIFGRQSKKVRIHLDSPINNAEIIELSLSSAGNILDENGGVLQPFSALSVENRVRENPIILNAATTKDGSGVLLYFDQYMDGESLSTGNFTVEGNSSYQVSSATLLPGEIDAHISKMVLLTLNETLIDTLEILTAQYVSGTIFGLYGGTVEPSDTIAVLNQISTDRATVTLTFEDGSELLENIFVKGSWNINSVPMHDDGTNADAIANDHIWTYSTQLTEGDFSWDVLERTEIMAFDTVITVDPVTGVVTITLNPIIINEDSLLSEQILLEFSVVEESVTGDTVYGIQNRDVIINLLTSGANETVFLMGIGGDWENGQTMKEINVGSLYADTLFNLTAGDVLTYNYRIGTDWENETPDPRTYVVKNGPNFIQDQFGVFTGIEDLEQSPLSIYPNPTNGKITLEGMNRISNLEIYSLSGQLIYRNIPANQNTLRIDLSHQTKGLYLIKAKTIRDQIFTYKFLLR